MKTRFKIEEFFGVIVSGGFIIIGKDISKDFIPLAYVAAKPAPVYDYSSRIDRPILSFFISCHFF